MIRVGSLLAAAVCLATQTSLVSAAELKVFSTIGVQAAMKELGPVFEKQTGDKLDFTFNTAAALTKRIQAGEHADAMILTRQNLETLAKENKASGHITPVASSGISVVVKSGAPKPDISTPEALKATLLKAKTIAYSNPAAGGASGVYVGKMIEGMGIADQVKDKTRHPPAGGNAANLVASGEAELAIQQTPEVMSASGVDLVGALPGDLNKVTHFAADISATPTAKSSAEAFVKFLTSPEAAKVFKARGLEPG
jgi:molybdate transport system substrate-binding protein